MTVMALANHERMRGKISTGRNAYPEMVMVKADGSWAGNAHWACKVLAQRDLIRMVHDPKEGTEYQYRYDLTDEGRSCLRGAMEIREDFDPITALRELDEVKVWG